MNLEPLAPVWTHLTSITPVRGEGPYLFERDGTRWLDFTSGIGVTNTGHAHPRVVAAIHQQADKLLFGQVNIVVSEPTLRLAKRLNEVTPDPIDRFFFSNSGAEAVEGAVKLARHATGKPNIIVFQGSFHGRTHQTMAMTTAKTVYRHRYGPLPSGVFIAPFPDAHLLGMGEDEVTAYCLEALEHLLKTQSAPDETAAVVLEPVLGEGGYVPAPDAFLRGLRELCDKHGILMVLDEIQTGFGRTGRFFCFEHAGITPDILVMAKGLGSGMPVSAIGANHALMECWEVGTHGGTYGGGNAVVMAAACATVETIREEGLAENAARMGERLMEGLLTLQPKHPSLVDVRGRGLMIGVVFEQGGKPDAAAAKRVQEACLEERLLLLTCGTYGNVIRWIPPLIVDEGHIDEALGVFRRALQRAETPVGA